MPTTSAVSAVQAADYREFVQPLTIQFFPAFFKLAAVQPGERVLDLGCGPGDATIEAALKAGAQGEVLGVDTSPEFIAIAQRRALEAGVSNVRFAVMDACALELGDAYWDVVISNLGATEFSDLSVALKEVQRVLRPVGRVALSTWGEAARSPWLGIPYDAAHAIVPARRPAAAAAPFRYGEPGVLSRVLAEAEYGDVTPGRVSAMLEYADAPAYWEAIERGLAYSVSPVAGLSEEQRRAAHEAGAAALRKWQHPRTGRLRLSAQAFICVAVK